MTTKNLALKSTLSVGLEIILACVLAFNSPPGQSDTVNNRVETISSPGENPQVEGEIDYGNAKPMPMPLLSVPSPSNQKVLPEIPSTDPIQDSPGSSPGDTGRGEENPQVLNRH
jgi:hypothetical protein